MGDPETPNKLLPASHPQTIPLHVAILATVPRDATTSVGSFSRNVLAMAFAFALVPLRLTTFGVLR